MECDGAVPGRIAFIGECMVELTGAGAPGLLRRSFAGDTFNAAYYARLCLPADWRVDYVTAVGADTLSCEMLAFMQGCGIGTTFARRVEGRSPGLYMVALRDDGERSFSYWRGQSAARLLAADPAHLNDALQGARAAHFSGITLAVIEDEGRRNLFAALEAARANGTQIIFDSNIRPALWPDCGLLRATLETAARLATILLPSFDDEAMVHGDRTPDETLSRLGAMGAKRIVVKNGARGAALLWDGQRMDIAAVAGVAAVDTTGAGDSFDGAFLARLLQSGEQDPQDACAAAAQAARIAAQVVACRGALIPPEALSLAQ